MTYQITPSYSVQGSKTTISSYGGSQVKAAYAQSSVNSVNQTSWSRNEEVKSTRYSSKEAQSQGFCCGRGCCAKGQRALAMKRTQMQSKW